MSANSLGSACCICTEDKSLYLFPHLKDSNLNQKHTFCADCIVRLDKCPLCRGGKDFRQVLQEAPSAPTSLASRLITRVCRPVTNLMRSILHRIYPNAVSNEQPDLSTADRHDATTSAFEPFLPMQAPPFYPRPYSAPVQQVPSGAPLFLPRPFSAPPGPLQSDIDPHFRPISPHSAPSISPRVERNASLVSEESAPPVSRAVLATIFVAAPRIAPALEPAVATRVAPPGIPMDFGADREPGINMDLSPDLDVDMNSTVFDADGDYVM